MDLKAASGSDMSKKKISKSAFHGPVGGFFSQKKKMVLGNVKHSGDEKNISLSKPGHDGVYSDLESESSSEEDNIIMEDIDNGSLLGSVANTSKTKRVNTSIVFGSLLGFPNYCMDDNEVVFPLCLFVSLEKK